MGTPLMTIAGVAIPNPSEYNATTSTVVDSARNAEGVMVGGVIRDDLAKVEMKWKFLPVDTWATIGKLFKISSGGSFINECTFFDETEGDFITRNLYVSDRTAGAYQMGPDGKIRGWVDCRLALIEV